MKSGREPGPWKGTTIQHTAWAFNVFWATPARPMPGYGRPWEPPTDVYETDASLVIQIEVAGLLPEDLNVAVEGDTLAIWGCRREARAPGNKVYYQTGINYGTFLVRVDLPVAVDPEAATAIYEKGFLTVNLPKRSPKMVQARRIQVSISP